MLFSSLEFILLFLPVTYSVYFLLPIKIKNYWLLIVSLFFYAWGEPTFVLIMIGSIIINYILALRIDELEVGKRGRKIVLIIDVILNLGILVVFKYLNFITATLVQWFPVAKNTVQVTNIALPIGISFFTFQALSYVIDVYREKVPAQRNIGYLGLYISLFPQLIAGPIVRYSTIMEQITYRKTTISSFSDGMLRFVKGFNKKILLANVLSEVADAAFSANGGSVCMAWLGAICYSLQIYYDFSGYSDMAIGLGKMLGFQFLENFDAPYLSKTITEFWRRWHISLGTWFRDYVYFPLGGSRVKTKTRLITNLMVVWLLTGIWHGANWTFILWGVLYGVMIIFEKLTSIPKKIGNWHKGEAILYRIFTLLLILLGWVLFRSENLQYAWIYLTSLFGLAGNTLVGNDIIFYGREYIVFLAFGVICCLPIKKWLCSANGNKCIKACSAIDGIGYVIQLILFIFSFSMLVMNAHNPFIYFNF